MSGDTAATSAAITAASEFIKPFESCRLQAYLCPAGVWTCGWGATGPDVVEGTVWTQEHADARLEQDVAKYVNGVLALCPGLDGDRLTAITSFAYNCGLAALERSTLRKRLNAGDWDAARTELRKWVIAKGRKLGGLVIRRDREAALV